MGIPESKGCHVTHYDYLYWRVLAGLRSRRSVAATMCTPPRLLPNAYTLIRRQCRWHEKNAAQVLKHLAVPALIVAS